MTEEEVNEIEKTCEDSRPDFGKHGCDEEWASRMYFLEVPRLVAEVRRLRAENKELRQFIYEG